MQPSTLIDDIETILSLEGFILPKLSDRSYRHEPVYTQFLVECLPDQDSNRTLIKVEHHYPVQS